MKRIFENQTQYFNEKQNISDQKQEKDEQKDNVK